MSIYKIVQPVIHKLQSFSQIKPYRLYNPAILQQIPLNRELHNNNQKTPDYKLTYFDLRAIAEPIRLIFAYAKVPYIDERIPFKKWSDMKPCKFM